MRRCPPPKENGRINARLHARRAFACDGGAPPLGPEGFAFYVPGPRRLIPGQEGKKPTVRPEAVREAW